MNINLDIETKVIERFANKTKRQRYLAFIQNEKTRKKFINDLSHATFFQEDLFEKIIGNESEIIKGRIKGLKNIKDCYVISENNKIDGKRMDIDAALNKAISSWADTGTLIVFGDAEIVYREAEGPNNKWISKPTKLG